MRMVCLICAVLLVEASTGFPYAQDADLEAFVQKKGPSARELLAKPTLYRETRLDGLPCSSEDFEFLLDRPRSSVALAGKLHKSLDKYVIEVRSPGVYHIDDGGHLSGDMELVMSRPGKRIYYISGYWKFVLGVMLRGRMVLVTEYKDKGGVKDRSLDVNAKGYMLVDNSVAGAAFKVAAYLFPEKVDARINRFATAVKKVVYAIHDDPKEAIRRLETAPHVPPGEAREFRARFL